MEIMQEGQVLTLFWLVPSFVFAIVLAVLQEKFGKRWLFSLIALLFLIIGAAVSFPIAECDKNSPCLPNFLPYVLTGISVGMVQSIIFSLLPNIAHPNALGTAFGII